MTQGGPSGGGAGSAGLDAPLVIAADDLAGFDWGVPALNSYSHRHADQRRRADIKSAFVLKETPAVILALYPLSAAEVDVSN